MNGAADIGFDKQTVVITGAGAGLGRAYALLFAARGASVVVNDLGGDVHGERDGHGAADQVVSEIVQAGGSAVACYDSVASPEGGRAIIDKALQTYGRVDALIHNAGILRDKSFLKLSPSDIRDVMDVHLNAAFWVGQPAFEVMQQQNYGRIVFTTSASGLFGNFGQANYGSAKTGLLGLMRVLNIEGARYGIQVNCVAPSARTRMTEGLLGPLTERLAPELVAPLVAYLCSRQCTLSGEILSAAGGRYARVFLGETQGWYSGGVAATPEQISEQMPRILDIDTFNMPKTGLEAVEILLDTFGVKPSAD